MHIIISVFKANECQANNMDNSEYKKIHKLFNAFIHEMNDIQQCSCFSSQTPTGTFGIQQEKNIVY
jgi:hypothetical protein